MYYQELLEVGRGGTRLAPLKEARNYLTLQPQDQQRATHVESLKNHWQRLEGAFHLIPLDQIRVGLMADSLLNPFGRPS